MLAIATEKARVLAQGRWEKDKRCCSWRKLVADVKLRDVIYGLDGRDESGGKTENESSHLICADGKQKTKGKEEVLPSHVEAYHVHKI